MISGPAGQTLYGFAEAMNVDGSMVTPFARWSTKAHTSLAILGGVSDIVAAKLKSTGHYDKFIQSIDKQLGSVMPQSLLQGSEIDFALPEVEIPVIREDFTSCRLMDFPATFAFGTATASF